MIARYLRHTGSMGLPGASPPAHSLVPQSPYSAAEPKGRRWPLEARAARSPTPVFARKYGLGLAERHDKATGIRGRCSMLGQTASASVRFEALDALRGV